MHTLGHPRDLSASLAPKRFADQDSTPIVLRTVMVHVSYDSSPDGPNRVLPAKRWDGE
jgi:hypothetical protein